MFAIHTSTWHFYNYNCQCQEKVFVLIQIVDRCRSPQKLIAHNHCRDKQCSTTAAKLASFVSASQPTTKGSVAKLHRSLSKAEIVVIRTGTWRFCKI